MTGNYIWVAGELKEINGPLTGSLSFGEVAAKYMEEISPRKKLNSQKSDFYRLKALNFFFVIF